MLATQSPSGRQKASFEGSEFVVTFFLPSDYCKGTFSLLLLSAPFCSFPPHPALLMFVLPFRRLSTLPLPLASAVVPSTPCCATIISALEAFLATLPRFPFASVLWTIFPTYSKCHRLGPFLPLHPHGLLLTIYRLLPCKGVPRLCSLWIPLCRCIPLSHVLYVDVRGHPLSPSVASGTSLPMLL